MRKGVFVLFLVLSINCFSQKEIKFRHLTTRNGLSNNNVLSVIQDTKGFLWFGTSNGLNRYDGYSFKIFENDPKDSTSLSDNKVRTIAEGHNGFLWVGTDNGLNYFDPATEQCRRFLFSEKDSFGISDNRINCLHLSKNNKLWIGTENGLNSIDLTTFKIERYAGKLRTRTSQINKSVTSIAEDAQGNIWLGMWWGGLKKIDGYTLQVYDYFLNQGDGNNNVVNVFVDSKNCLWAVYHLGGIRKIDLNFQSIIPISALESKKEFGAIDEDREGNLWIMSGTGSLTLYQPSTKQSVDFVHNIQDATGVSSGTITDIFCDSNGIVWITTDKGIDYYDPNAQKFELYYHKFNFDKRDYCKTFYQDRYNQVWISVWDIGLVKYNLSTSNYQIISHEPTNQQSISSNRIDGILADQSGNIWVATYNGINILDPLTNKVLRKIYHTPEYPSLLKNIIHANTTGTQAHFFWLEPTDSLKIIDVKNQKELNLPLKGKGALNDSKIKCMIADSHGDFWIGTEYAGLNHYNVKTGEMVYYVNEFNDSTSLSSNVINDVFEDHSGTLWIATQNGLNRFNKHEKKFTRFSRDNGLSSNVCFAVKEDRQNRLWISTSAGLDRFDQGTGNVFTYNESDGLSISNSIIYQSTAGEFFCGNAERGFYKFHPDQILEHTNKQPLYITDFFIANQPVPIQKGNRVSPLKKSILYTDKIILNSKQTVFGFEFTELNYTFPEKNSYAYMMEGFDEQWLKTDASHRRVTYTNLNPGTYLFKVKSDNNNELVKSVTIVVLPPWWKTWWAYTFYFLALFVLLLTIRKYLIDKNRLQHEFEIQKIEASKNAEVAQLKQHFFTNISHEFRTPLTLISGPINKLITSSKESKPESEVLKYYHLIERNVNRLTELTNQLLDFRKIESGSMRMDIHHGNLVGFIQGIYERFVQLAESKQIDFQFYTSVVTGEAWFDTDKLDKVITNVISNALKFTPDRGRVSIQIEENTTNYKNFLITVKDTGIGIPNDQLEHIFDRFYQVDHPVTNFFEGTGIGLALAQELIQMMGGSICVESIKEVGSTFIIDFPKDIRNIGFEQQLIEPITFDQSIAGMEETLGPWEYNQSERNALHFSPTNKVTHKPTVLVIEDNIDLRFYIVDTLKDYYQIESAENGEVGIEKAFASIPDLVISDIRMPVKDGIEVVKTLKTDLRTSHIPILLLTALNTTEYQLKGFETGADDYITKPFNADILLLKLRNAITLQKRAKEYYLGSLKSKMGAIVPALELHPKEIILKNFEEQFLQQVLDLVEQNISNPDYTVEKLAAEMNMEASTLYKKLMALIGLPPSDFIRDIRMKRAAQLLGQNKLPIAEIAYMVGFDSPNYFSKVFKKYHQLTPTEYILQKSKG